MQYKVPQFIDVEDKVFGSLTFRQFVYLAGGAGFVYLWMKILPIYFGLPLAALFGGLGVALAFYKYNEKPFIHLLESLARFYTKSRLYLWHPATTPQRALVEEKKTKDAFDRKALTESKLKTLSWSLDVIDDKK